MNTRIKRTATAFLGLIAAVTMLAGTATSAHAEDYRAFAAAHGGTLGNAALQSDVMRNMRVVASTYDHCSTASISKKAVVAFDGNAWSENWTLNDCGHVRTIPIVFKKSPAGGVDFTMAVQP